MEENIFNPSANEESVNPESLKNVTKVVKAVGKIVATPDELSGLNEDNIDLNSPAFKVCKTNLPEKTSIWTKVRNALFYEIKVELTPYQQKVENEINEFLHQEVTFAKIKDLLFKEITFGKSKKV